MSEFYCYRHIRPDLNIPFYIGIGTKLKYAGPSAYSRAYNTRKKERSDFWYRIFQKCNKQIEIEIIFESTDQNEIKNKEKEFIALYGRADIGTGTLVNFTDGGDGIKGAKIDPSKIRRGWRHTEESKRLMSEHKKGKHSDAQREAKKRRVYKKHTEESKEKMRVAQRARTYWPKKGPMSKESKAKISLANSGKPKTEEHKEKLRQANLGKTPSAETREKLRLSNLGKRYPGQKRRTHSPESKEKIRQWHLNKPPVSEETKQKISTSKTGKPGHKHTEEYKAKMALLAPTWTKGRKHTPEAKLKMSLARKGKPSHNIGRKASEETKAKMRLAYSNQLIDPNTGRFKKKK